MCGKVVLLNDTSAVLRTNFLPIIDRRKQDNAERHMGVPPHFGEAGGGATRIILSFRT